MIRIWDMNVIKMWDAIQVITRFVGFRPGEGQC